MALSRLRRLNEICDSKNFLLVRQRVNNTTKSKQFKTDKKHEPTTPAQRKIDSMATPFQAEYADHSNLQTSRLWRPLVFTVGFSVACFGGAAIWEYENMRSHAVSMLKKPISAIRKRLEGHNVRNKHLIKWWNSLTTGEKVFVPICATNVLVFAAWRVPKWQPFMIRYFCSNPGSKSVCLPMLLSTFSHYSGLHLLANMYVLHSFSTGAVQSLGKEQFLGLYLGAGVISSFTSYLYKIATKQPGLSLGASGAIMAILGYICTQYPDTRLGIILLPFFTFSAGAAIKFIIGLDTAGVLLGWKFFDHAAHLGGAGVGILWAYYGNQYIWQNREPLLHYWHDVRGAIK